MTNPRHVQLDRDTSPVTRAAHHKPPTGGRSDW